MGQFAFDFVLSAYGKRPGNPLIVTDNSRPAGQGSRRLDPAETLRDAGVRNGSVLTILQVATAGGFALPEFLAFIEGSVIAGVAGNAAYDLMKLTFRSIGHRWASRGRSSQSSTFQKEEAVAVARTGVCLKFSISEPDRLELRGADPILLDYDHTGVQRIKVRRGGRTHSRSWRCVFDVHADGMPDSITILVSANPPEPERTLVYLLPE